MAQTASNLFDANRAVSRLALTVAATDGATRRKRIAESGSLRLRFPHTTGDELEAVMVNTGGGIAGGDRLDLSFTLEAGARLAVTSTAAEKIYRSHGPDARIDLSLRAAAGAALRWLPQETILFDGAGLDRRIEIDLAADASLIVVEALVLGRTAMGESVRQGRVFDRWRLRRDGRLVFADALRLDGDLAAQMAAAAAGGGGIAIATLLVAPGDDDTVARLRALGESRGEYGASAWSGIAMARFVAADGAALRHDLSAALAALGSPPPRLWVN